MVYPHMYRTEKSETRTTNSTYGDYYHQMISNKISIQPKLLKILQYMDSRRSIFLENLDEIVAIKSISDDIKYKEEVVKMIKHTEDWLNKLTFTYECFNIGTRIVDGKCIKLLPVILATLGNDPKKKTLCVYAHLDVNTPNMNEWNTDPWKLNSINKRLYGNGAALGKGALMCWFQAIRAFKSTNIDIPINLKFIIESMNRCGSIGLEDFLCTKRQDFLYNVDYVTVCDTEWLGEKHPCLTYGTVGYVHIDIFYEKTEDSGTDIRDDAAIIAKELVSEEGEILIKGHSDRVVQITPDEEKLYRSLVDFNIEEYRENLPEYQRDWSECKILMHFWRLPALYINEIEECICEKRDTSIIKQHLIYKIVPSMIPDMTFHLLEKHVKNVCKEKNIENKVECVLKSQSRTWYEDFQSPNYVAATRAIIQIYKEGPNFIRDDKDNKVINILSRVLNTNLLLLPLCNKYSNLGSSNENISTRNYHEGTKLISAYILQLGSLHV